MRVAVDPSADPAEQARARALEALLGDTLDRLASPALLVDLAALDANVAALLRRCPADRWRPHVKTLKSGALVRRLWAAGVPRCKCATLDELQMLLRTAAAEGRDDLDVLFAYPLHQAAFRAARRLVAAHPPARVTYLADAPEHARALSAWTEGPLALALDVDLGMGRTGAPPAAWARELPALARLPHLRLCGLHGYEGHLEWDQRDAAARAHDALCDLAEAHRGAFAELEITTSGTHSFAAALAHPRLSAGPWEHRISPGTIVLSDLRSAPAAGELGLQPAALVLARVVSRGPGRVTLDAGSKAIAPDRPPPNCRVLGWPGLQPARPSEEHLPVHGPGALPPLGAPLFLVPDHVCTTVNLYSACLLLGPGAPPERAPIGAQGHRLFLDDEIS